MGKLDFSERRKMGTYVCCNYTELTAQKLAAWCVKNLIPQPLASNHYHTTILYSRKPILNTLEIFDTIYDDLDFKVIGFKLFNSIEDPDVNALILELDAPQLVDLHEKLIAAGGTHDYDDYTPHVTVSYKAPSNIDLNVLELPDFMVTVSSFKTEPLDHDWKN